jgi:hypothetical protein
LILGAGPAWAIVIIVVIAGIAPALVPVTISKSATGRTIGVSDISIIVPTVKAIVISVPVSISKSSVKSPVKATVPAIPPAPACPEGKTAAISVAKVIDPAPIVRIGIISIRIPAAGIYTSC